ncbi:MAG: carboxypeptidase-like regulatory domain-containing protein [Myxococcales bacterium]|nr:carboxypeptidase-like regulatory domain-containing protein [Myxococcales bacterium]
MNRSPLTVVALLCLVAAVVLGVWKASGPETSTSDEGTTAEADEAPRKSKWFWQSDDDAHVDAPEPTAPPRTRSLHFTKPDGAAVEGARVSIFESKLVEPLRAGHHTFLECDDQQHLTAVAASLREGSMKRTLLAEAVTDERGVASFGERLWPDAVVIFVETPGLPDFTNIDGSGREEFVLPDEVIARHETSLTVFDNAGDPIAARATFVNVGAGDVKELRTDSSGILRVHGAATLWGIIEADGFFPVAVNLEDASEDFPVMMSKPGTVEVTTPPALGSFGLQLVKRHPRPVKVRDGRALFEHQRPGYVSVEVTEPGFLGSADGQLEEGARLVLALQVKRAGRLLVTVVSTDGMPVPEASATLTAPTNVVTAESTEEGQRLELGPIGEGPAVLRVTAPGFKTRAQSLELAPGDTDLEVVLAEAPTLRGRVVDSKSQPVADVAVQVRSDSPNDPDGVVSAADGTFTLHVDEEGSWLVEAIGLDGDVARETVQVPGPEVVLRLEPLGSALVTVVGPDGKPALGARVMLAGSESPEPDFGETPETGELFFEQLVPGEYRVEVDDGSSGANFLPHQQELTIRSGETSRLSVRVRPSATLEGTVVDAENAPVPYAMVFVKGSDSWSAETNEEGLFSIPGLAPGVTVELAIDLEGTIGLTPSTAKVGVAKQVFKTIAGGKVTGRVVSHAGAPVLEFAVNGVDFSTEDGRFEAVANTLDRLDVRDFEGAGVDVVVAGRKDVGDVVLKESPMLAGVVVDETRQPLAGVHLESNAFSGEVLTDSEGRFETALVSEATSVSVQARHGELGTFTDVPVGKGFVEIVLTPPTRIDGLVRSSGNRGVVTSVLIRGSADEEVQVDTDAEGHFQVSLAPGTWFFGTRASQTSTSVRVSGRQQRVELGITDEACEVSVRGLPLPMNVMLVPASLGWAPESTYDLGSNDVPPGAVALGSAGSGFAGRGLTCGAWVVHAMYGSQVVWMPVTLGRGPNIVTVRPPSLSSIGEEVGMTRHGPAGGGFRGDSRIDELLRHGLNEDVNRLE